VMAQKNRHIRRRDNPSFYILKGADESALFLL